MSRAGLGGAGLGGACLVAALAAAPAAWAQQAVSPFTSAPDTRQLDDEEARVWYASREFDRALSKRGHLFGEKALDAYLQELTEALYPEFRGAVRVRAVRDSALNAFALPNGSLYIHIGLIGRLDNEAQLATVLAHECAHFVHRHGLRHQQSLKANSAFALGAALVGGGVGSLLGNLAAVSSIYGFSRDLEREADSQGFARLQRQGYSLRESVRVFEIMETEARLLDVKEPYMFASHPKLRERIDSFTELSAAQAQGDGRTEAQRFLERAQRARIAWLEEELDRMQHKSVIHHLTREGAAGRYPPFHTYYLAEAYVRRAEEGDEAKAQQAYRAAIEAAPDFAPSYRGLGLLRMKRGENAGARELFDQYLKRAPEAADAAYVKGYIEQLEAASR